MRFALLSNVACLLIVVVAQTTPTANPPKIPIGFMATAGQPTTFQWTPTTAGTVTLTLRSGAASDLNKGTIIQSSIPNSGSATFTIPASTTRNSDYTIEIASDSDPGAVNYTPQFVVESLDTVEFITPFASASVSGTATVASSPTLLGRNSSKSISTTSSASAASVSTASSVTSGSSSSSKAPSKNGSSSSSSSGGSTSSHTGSKTAPMSGASVNIILNRESALVAIAFEAVALWWTEVEAVPF